MEVLIILALILLNGLFSMSEIALVSARKNRLEADAQRGDRRAKAALDLANDPSRFLSTVQIGITLIGVLTGIYSGENITEDVKTVVQDLPYIGRYAHPIGVISVVMMVTFFSLILGELVPKRIGLNMPEPIAKAVAIPMRAVAFVASPFIWLLTRTGDLLMFVLRIKPRLGGGVTEDEIKAMVQEGTEGGAVAQIEQDIVERVFSLGDRRVSSLMTHRRDLVVLHMDDSAEEVERIIRTHMHGQYPVVEENLDDTIGLVSLKDLLMHVRTPQFELRSLVKRAGFLPEDLPAYKALESLKTRRERAALVADELGVTTGLVTLGDIMEALVGDVSDFHRDEYTLVQRADGSWLVDGQYPLHELLVRLDRSTLARDVDVDTIAGLILQQIGHIPKAGEAFVWMGLRIEVADMDGIRIDKVIIGPVAA